MKIDKIAEASDRLDVICDKIGLMRTIALSADFKNYIFHEKDMVAFGWILRDMQEEIEEIKELLDKNL